MEGGGSKWVADRSEERPGPRKSREGDRFRRSLQSCLHERRLGCILGYDVGIGSFRERLGPREDKNTILPFQPHELPFSGLAAITRTRPGPDERSPGLVSGRLSDIASPMYTRCLACRAHLGRNDCLEELPVGRILAFDPIRGRLWVVCRACRSWNLAPLLERWEPLEELDRLFEVVQIETSSEKVAQGRAKDGTSLIRVGRVDRREFAFWRYAKRLRTRWKRAESLGYVIVGAPFLLGSLAGVPMYLGVSVYAGLATGLLQWRDRQPLLNTDDGRLVRKGDGSRILLKPGGHECGWHVEIPRRGRPITLVRDEALRALRAALPRTNLYGGKGIEVDEAVYSLQQIGSASDGIQSLADRLSHMRSMDSHHHRFVVTNLGPARPYRVSTAKPALRLALEIAVNEELERRALAGEMALLEREWREAEELAAISDSLLVPEWVEEWLSKRRAALKQDADPRRMNSHST